MNLEDHTVTRKGKPVELTAKEFEILKLFLQNPKRVYTKEQLFSLVWKDAYLGDENAVNVHMSRLWNKIEEDSRNPRYVVTVWGIGYKLGDVLLGIILYQQYTFHQGTQARLGELHHTLGKILDGDSREQVMVFTENPKLKELAAQINRLLERQRKIQADYSRSELASGTPWHCPGYPVQAGAADPG